MNRIDVLIGQGFLIFHPPMHLDTLADLMSGVVWIGVDHKPGLASTAHEGYVWAAEIWNVPDSVFVPFPRKVTARK